MLTTHDIGDIEDLCKRIVVLDEGKKIYDGSLDKLVNRFSSRRLVMQVERPEDFELKAEGVKEIKNTEEGLEVVFDREVISASDLMRIILEDYEVQDFQIREPDIEEVVKKVYNEGI
jgi:ABC-2 type transport system ATP-binding protein